MAQETRGIAFPGAEGYGKYAQGGRCGKVIEVTTLNCDGPGSFYEAIMDPDPRTIVFKVGGIIDCSRHYGNMYPKGPYMTIAGQTAPGDGILVKGTGIHIDGSDVIIRYMQFRPGENVGPGIPLISSNALGIGDVENVIVDHTALSWSADDLGGCRADNCTLQWNIYSEGMHCAVSKEEPGYCHSKGIIIGYQKPIRVSVHHNLFAQSSDRNPAIQSGTVDLINNVMHAVGGAPLAQPYRAPYKLNYIGNYYTDTGQKYPYQLNWFMGNERGVQFAPQTYVYPKGNIHPTLRPNNNLPETALMNITGSPSQNLSATRIPGMTYFSEADAFQAYNDVLADAGPNKKLNADGTFSPRRSVIDTRVIDNVKAGGGMKLINLSVNEVGGYPVMQNGTPYPDADHDGMSDVWEVAKGFDPANPDDRNQDADRDGYTNLEEFLNGTDPGTPSPSDDKACTARGGADVAGPGITGSTGGDLGMKDQNCIPPSQPVNLGISVPAGAAGKVYVSPLVISAFSADSGTTEKYTFTLNAGAPMPGTDGMVWEVPLSALGGLTVTPPVGFKGPLSIGVSIIPPFTPVP